MRPSDLIEKFKDEIMQKLAPGLHKQGYEEPRRTTETEAQTSAPLDPLRVSGPRRNPAYPGYAPAAAAPYGNPDLDPFSAAPGLVYPG